MTPASPKGIHSWADAWRIYCRPRVVAMVFLGFSAGLPFLLVFSTLSAWLRDFGVSRTTIGFFSWIGITYSIKVFWAPVIDHLSLPLLTAKLGHRRSWILLGQLGIIIGLLGMAAMDPTEQLALLAVFALLVAFASATQDISIDAYRIEALEEDYQGAMAAAYILGYRVALLAAGAGALFVAEYASWMRAYQAMAGLMLLGIITTLLVAEPTARQAAKSILQEPRVQQFLEKHAALPSLLKRFGAWFLGAVVCPFTDFFVRNGRYALIILALIGLYKLSDITMGVMANPLYLDLGYSKATIAEISKAYGFFMSIVGAALGGSLVVRYGILKPLLLGAILVASTNLCFVWLAQQAPEKLYLAIVISADNISGGLASTAFIAYLSSLTNQAYTATQYALFSSLMTLPAKFTGGFSGVVVDHYGYPLFFTYAAILGIPAILLSVFMIMKHDHMQQTLEDNAQKNQQDLS